MQRLNEQEPGESSRFHITQVQLSPGSRGSPKAFARNKAAKKEIDLDRKLPASLVQGVVTTPHS